MADSAAYVSLAVRLTAGSTVPTFLYLKAHRPADGTPIEAALFVAGLPFCLTQPNVEGLFGAFGQVDQVQVHPKRTSAIIVFSERAGVSAALKAARKGAVIQYPVPEPADGETSGLRARVDAHKAQYPGNAALQKSLDTWMENFEQEEERRRKAAEEAAAGDGWTVVTKRAGRKRKSGNTISGGLSQSAAQARADRKKPKVNDDFYRFQQREKKKTELVDLRTKFADAQKQLQTMRDTRKFRT